MASTKFEAEGRPSILLRAGNSGGDTLVFPARLPFSRSFRVGERPFGGEVQLVFNCLETASSETKHAAILWFEDAPAKLVVRAAVNGRQFAHLAQFDPDRHDLFVYFWDYGEEEGGLKYGGAPDASSVILDSPETVVHSDYLTVQMIATERDAARKERQKERDTATEKTEKQLARHEELLAQLALAVNKWRDEMKQAVLLPTVLLALLVAAAAFQALRRFFGL